MKFEKVLVTGTGGQLGSYTAAELKGRCEVHGFDARPSRGDIPRHVGDITDPAAMAEACKGIDALLHIAARPNIWSGTGDEIVRVNTMGVWTVLNAAEAAGVRRVVLCSSDSVVGFTVMSGGLKPPDYLPIDAAHPLRPTDPYAVSKLLGEQIGRSFDTRGKLEVIVLRPVFVLYPEMESEVKARAANPADYRGVTAGRSQPGGRRPGLALCRSAGRRARFPPGARSREAPLRGLFHQRSEHAGSGADARAVATLPRRESAGAPARRVCAQPVCASL